jgi:hypothetical protein
MVFQKGHKFTPKKKDEVKIEDVQAVEVTTELEEKIEEVKTTYKRKKLCVIHKETKQLISVYEDEFSPELHICI